MSDPVDPPRGSAAASTEPDLPLHATNGHAVIPARSAEESTVEADGNMPSAPPHAPPTREDNSNDDAALAAAAAAASPATARDSFGSIRRSPGAPAVSNRWRTFRYTLLILAALALLTALAWGPYSYRRTQLLTLQSQCLKYSPADGVIVYDASDAGVAEKAAMGGGYVSLPGPDDGEIAATPALGQIPDIWRRYRAWAIPRDPEPGGAVLFMGQRQTLGGVRGLAVLEADHAGRRLRATFIRPGAMTHDPGPTTDTSILPLPRDGLIDFRPGPDPFASKLPEDPISPVDLRFYAGRADNKDGTRFTVPYELNGQPGDLEIWINNERTFYYVDRRYIKQGKS